MLAERGQLSLRDPIGEYFADFPKAEGIAVRHLLGYASGTAMSQSSPCAT